MRSVIFVVFVAMNIASNFAIAAEEKRELNLVPIPKAAEMLDGSTTLSPWLSVSVPVGAVNSGAEVKEIFSDLGLASRKSASLQLTLRLVNKPLLGQEGYELEINQAISIKANTDAGLFYGLQTLRQLMPSKPTIKPVLLPNVRIVDSPKFEWRGSMLDVSRNFFDVNFLKKHIDKMALFKLNRLHLHLSDDQGWRIEIKKYPLLTKIGGASAVAGGRAGFYTQDEMRDLIAYAKQNHVEIIPEIDMPGHSQAAIASYNQLACDGVDFLDVYTGVQVGFSTFCLGDNSRFTKQFVTDVIGEIAQLFPFEYIHIGGDEIKVDGYKEFIEFVSDLLEKSNKKMIGWEEVSAAHTRSDNLLQLWNDEFDISSAVARGHKIILSPCSYLYLDHSEDPKDVYANNWCKADGVSLARVYSFDPSIFNSAVGIEAPLWTELILTDERANERLWPRLLAVAELAWSSPANKDFDGFVARARELERFLY